MLARTILVVLDMLHRMLSALTGQGRGRVRRQDPAAQLRAPQTHDASPRIEANRVLRPITAEVDDPRTGCKEQAVGVSPPPAETDSGICEAIETEAAVRCLDFAERPSAELGVAPETAEAHSAAVQTEDAARGDGSAPPASVEAEHGQMAETLVSEIPPAATGTHDTAPSTTHVISGRGEQCDNHSEESPTLSVQSRSVEAGILEDEQAQLPTEAQGVSAADFVARPESGQPRASMVSDLLAEPQMDVSTNAIDGSIMPVDNDIETGDRLSPAASQQELGGIEQTGSTQQPKSSVKVRSSSGPRAAPRSHADHARASVSPEDTAQPFLGARIQQLSPEYMLWNKAVLGHCLQTYASENEDVYLTITPTILAGALGQLNGLFLSPEEAAARFVDAVSAVYRSSVLPHAKKLQVLRRCGDDGLPECAAFLALSVLAAYRMRTEDGVAASAYYKRLEELLRCGMSGGLPRGFDGDDFEGLWCFVRDWFVRAHGRHIAMPGADGALRRFVALPLMHVPLRQVDIERLPDFFDWAGYEPGEGVTIEKISVDLIQWTRARGGFTVSGMNALSDDRRPAVLAQITQELECWDGSVVDSQGKRVASVEVFLHWHRRLPVLSYLPRRPGMFPSTFDDGLHMLDAGQEGWYEPVPIGGDDGSELQSGFAWEAVADGIRFVLRRSGGDAIAMAPSEFDGPLSHSSLLLGAPNAVLCVDSVVDRVRQYLETVTVKRCMPVGASVPVGWKLFVPVSPIRASQPPDGLEMLEVTTKVEIIPTGGLRLGRRWAWLTDAPPTLVVTGVESTVPILIDGEAVHADQDGVIKYDGRLNRPGVHLVEVGRVRRRLEMVLPELPTDMAGPAQCIRPSTAAALPPGSWTVIGTQPGEVTYAASGRWGHGALASCPFIPVWAVSFGAGRGAVVLPLAEPLPPPGPLGRRSTKRSLQEIRRWAEAVYGAHIRRPRFCSAPTLLVDRQTYTAWNVYVSTAREVKRVLRSERR